MQLSEMQFRDARPVDGYGPGFFRIGGDVHEGAVLAYADTVTGWGGYDDTAALLALAGEVDVIFIGTGADIAHLPPDFRTTLEAAGVAVEPMSSPSAARTYNVLASEARRVAVALLPV